MLQPPHLVELECFDDAREMANRFISGQAVLVSVAGVERETARRAIDFGSGLCYAGGGSLQRVRLNLYLLLPKGEKLDFDPSWDPDNTPLEAVVALPVEDWLFTDAVSTKKVG